MTDYKRVVVDEDTHKRLILLKYDNNNKTLNEVIKGLLDGTKFK